MMEALAERMAAAAVVGEDEVEVIEILDSGDEDEDVVLVGGGAVDVIDLVGWSSGGEDDGEVAPAEEAVPSPRTRTPRTPRKPRAAAAREPPACARRGADVWLAGAWAQVAAADEAEGRRRARAYSFARVRAAAAAALLRYFDENVLAGRLGTGGEEAAPRVEVGWNARLLKTAGVTYMRRVGGERRARIELSVKVVDDADRLYCTLAHEVCHATAWLVDDVARPPHGREFKAWAAVFRRWDAALGITTCHEYEIQFRFVYTCQECGYAYGRHSRSIDVARQLCGKCKGRLVLHAKKAAEIRAEVTARRELAAGEHQPLARR
jgi:predicted SprT family Zn-dependent metalloprotease